MVYITIDDFHKRADSCVRLTREEEIACAKRMQAGDMDARQKLIESYLPVVTGFMKRDGKEAGSLHLALSCEQMLEKQVDTFDFLQDGETFTHRISWGLRQEITKYIASR